MAERAAPGRLALHPGSCFRDAAKTPGKTTLRRRDFSALAAARVSAARAPRPRADDAVYLAIARVAASSSALVRLDPPSRHRR